MAAGEEGFEREVEIAVEAGFVARELGDRAVAFSNRPAQRAVGILAAFTSVESVLAGVAASSPWWKSREPRYALFGPMSPGPAFYVRRHPIDL